MKTKYRGHVINSHPYYSGKETMKNRMLKIFVDGETIIRHTPTKAKFIAALDEAVLAQDRGVQVAETVFFLKRQIKKEKRV